MLNWGSNFLPGRMEVWPFFFNIDLKSGLTIDEFELEVGAEIFSKSFTNFTK